MVIAMQLLSTEHASPFEQLLSDTDDQLLIKNDNTTNHGILPPPTTASQHYQFCHNSAQQRHT